MLVEAWDGKSWQVQSTPSPPGASASSLSGVSCTARSCVAVGWFATSTGQRRPLVERRRGGRWSVEPATPPSGARYSSLNAVSCVPTACMAVGAADNDTLIERWDRRTWSLQQAPKRGVLLGVSCTSARACVAVGSFAGRAVAERWNGARWVGLRAASAPTPRGDSQTSYDTATTLKGVSCASETACTAVGSQTTTMYCDSDSCPVTWTLMLAERWDGKRWSLRKTPNPNGDAYEGVPIEFSAVSCATVATCTAVGPFIDLTSGLPRTFAERWTGARWSIERTFNAAGPAAGQGGDLSGVWCARADGCIAVGSYTINGRGSPGGTQATLTEELHRGRWTRRSTPSPSSVLATGSVLNLNGISCTAPAACMAVGARAIETPVYWPEAPFGERWNGRTWSIQIAPRPAGAHRGGDAVLRAVSCVTARQCVAVGYFTDEVAGYSFTLVERWNGVRWSIQRTTRLVNSELDGIDCLSVRNCVAVGRWRSGGLAERWDGRSWRREATPRVPGGGTFQTTLSGVSCATLRRCEAVGTTVTNFDQPNSNVGLAEAWNGATWRLQNTPQPPHRATGFNGVSCISARSCVAVGDIVARWSGAHWSLEKTPATNQLHAVSCTAHSRCVAVGGPPAYPGEAGPGWDVEDVPPLAEQYF